MAARSDSYGPIGHSGGSVYDIGHSGGSGYDVGHSGGGYPSGGGYDSGHSGGGGYSHSGGYDSGHSFGYGGGGGYDHPVSYSHDSHGGSYGGYGNMDCPGVPIALLLTTILGIGVLGFILFTKIQGAGGRRKRNANQSQYSLLPVEDFLTFLDFGMKFISLYTKQG